MIAKLSGQLEYLRDNYVVLNVGGVGYKVFVTAHTFGKIALSEKIEFFTHTYVREDILALYGFLSLEELEMFELLISISGIGPKAALGILSLADPKAIRTAIVNDDVSILTRVSGVGKKTAERVILELKNKVVALPAHEMRSATADSEALEALLAMGYAAGEAREVLKEVAKEITDVGQRVKESLRLLGQKKRG